ncbi:MAG TPA: radical SAM protein, partial [bacterium]|nr:radical SAM protein [bacterium]
MSSFDLIMEEGKRFMREGQYPFAEKSLEAAVCLNEGNANLWFELGKACYLQEKHLKAVAALKKSLSLDGGNLNALLLLAKSYKESRAYKEAIGSFKELLEKGFTGENLHRELADLYRTLGKFDRAAEELKKAFESGYDEKEYLSALGNTYRDLIKSVQLCNMEGDVSKALELAGKAQNIIPKNQRMYQNILLNEKEIACREINLESEVRSLTVTLTNRCNLACLMCQTRLIPWDVPEKTRKEIISLFPVLERVMWQGGEAFLYDGFKELLQEAGRYPLRNVIVTNGALITEELAELMVKGNVELTFSIDGATKEVYEHVRRGARFERVLESIGMINAFRKKHNPGMQLRLNVLVMEANVHQLEAFLDFAKEHNFNTIFYNSTGCDFTNEKENIFLYRNEKALQDMQKAKVRLHKKANEYGLRLEDWLP